VCVCVWSSSCNAPLIFMALSKEQMGLCGSSATEEFLRSFPRTLQTLHMDEKATELVRHFHDIDKDQSGRVGMVELLNYLDLPRNRFLERCVGLEGTRGGRDGAGSGWRRE
jgi:hypothetical protein